MKNNKKRIKKIKNQVEIKFIHLIHKIISYEINNSKIITNKLRRIKKFQIKK